MPRVGRFKPPNIVIFGPASPFSALLTSVPYLQIKTTPFFSMRATLHDAAFGAFTLVAAIAVYMVTALA